jgi:hypothetical protein
MRDMEDKNIKDIVVEYIINKKLFYYTISDSRIFGYNCDLARPENCDIGSWKEVSRLLIINFMIPNHKKLCDIDQRIKALRKVEKAILQTTGIK